MHHYWREVDREVWREVYVCSQWSERSDTKLQSRERCRHSLHTPVKCPARHSPSWVHSWEDVIWPLTTTTYVGTEAHDSSVLRAFKGNAWCNTMSRHFITSSGLLWDDLHSCAPNHMQVLYTRWPSNGMLPRFNASPLQLLWKHTYRRPTEKDAVVRCTRLP